MWITKEEKEKSNGADYHTTQFKYDHSHQVKCIRVRVAEEKFVEKLQFLNKTATAEEEIKKNDERVIAQLKPCECGDDVLFNVPEGYTVVGFFGLTSTDKFSWKPNKPRQLDHVRGLGFITMKLML